MYYPLKWTKAHHEEAADLAADAKMDQWWWPLQSSHAPVMATEECPVPGVLSVEKPEGWQIQQPVLRWTSSGGHGSQALCSCDGKRQLYW